jgi:voltage-gated potassium channel
MHRLIKRIDQLYNGRSRRAATFRYALLAFDMVTITFFVVASMLPHEQAWFLAADYAIVSLLILDFAARLAIAKRRWRHLLQLTVIADLVVIITLLLPAVIENLAFLRVMRALRLLRSYRVLRDLRGRSRFIRRNEHILDSILNLAVFIFVVTALVYVLQVRVNPGINNYVDALYFTVTTLTTTGFGDVTLQGEWGRLLSILIMVFGVGLFLRLVQTIFRPAKVRFECPTCGLSRHDPDAVHCKHCGEVLHIETEGL